MVLYGYLKPLKTIIAESLSSSKSISICLHRKTEMWCRNPPAVITTNIAVKYGSNTEKAKGDFYLLLRSDFPYISHNLRTSNCNSFYLWVYEYWLWFTRHQWNLNVIRFTLIFVWVMFFHMIIQIFWDSEYSLSYDSPQFILTPIDKPQAQHM